MRKKQMVKIFQETPWAILPEKLAELTELVQLKLAGEKIEPQALARPSTSVGSIAVLPLQGVITQKADFFSSLFGGTSTEGFSKMFKQTLADPEVGLIVIDIDSPGGTVPGVEELASEIFAARGKKRIIAVANSFAASAAYWIASAADEIVVTPSAGVGSIGVFAVHQDFSKFMEDLGVKTTLIGAGKFKTEKNPFEPLSKEAKDAIQDNVDEFFDMFTKAVARGRGVKASEVKKGFGEGRVVTAREAVKLGMADRIATLDQTLARLVGRKNVETSGFASVVDSPVYDVIPTTTDRPNIQYLDGDITDQAAPPVPIQKESLSLEARERRMRLNAQA